MASGRVGRRLGELLRASLVVGVLLLCSLHAEPTGGSTPPLDALNGPQAWRSDLVAAAQHDAGNRVAPYTNRITKHNLQPYLRVLNIGDGSTALPAPPARLQGGDRPASWPDPWRAHAADPPLTYRKALWQIMSRREQLAVQFIGSQKDGPSASALNGGLHEGYGGASVARLEDVKQASLLGTRHPPDVVIICAGFGDLYGHTNVSRASEDLLTSLTRLVQSLHRRPRSNTTTLVCRLPLPEDDATCTLASGCPLLEAVLKTNRMLPEWAGDLEHSTRRPVCTHWHAPCTSP